MLQAVALPRHALSLQLLGLPDVQRRLFDRGGELEVQFHYRDPLPLLPVCHEGLLKLVTWGNRRRGGSPSLPCTGWTTLATVGAGGWNQFGAAEVEISAYLGLDNGVWYHIRQGAKGMLVTDERRVERAYVICEPASYYYKIMSRSDWMPCLIGERF